MGQRGWEPRQKGIGGKSIKVTQAKFVNVIKSSHAYYWNLTWFL